MNSRAQHTVWRGLVVSLGIGLVLGLGCSESPVVDPPVAEVTRHLSVTASTPRATGAGFAIDISWSAEYAADAVIYEWAVGASRGSADYVVANALKWTRTTETFVILEFDERGDTPWVGVDPRARTFYVRAMDAGGTYATAAAELSFTPRTVAPEAQIILPTVVPLSSCILASRRVAFGWAASDPDTKGGAPEAVRYILWRVGGPSEPCLTRLEYEATDPIGSLATEDPRWSDWIVYDRDGDFRGAPGGIDIPGALQIGDTFLFAVQARDVDGATSRDFTWNRAVRHFRVGVDQYPSLMVTEETSQVTEAFVATNGVVSADIVAGQPLQFSWEARSDYYVGLIDAYRYGWDVADPDDPNDPGWSVDWGIGPLWRFAPARSFVQGIHSFVIQARDNSGVISRGQFQFTVHQIPASRRSVLLVDDWRDLGEASLAQDAEWDATWNRILGSLIPGFDPGVDVIDAQTASSDLTLARLLEYDAVIWFVSSSNQSFIATRFAPTSLSQQRWNWLNFYQQSGGNLLLVGPGAIKSTVAGANWIYPLPFDDPLTGDLGFGIFSDFSGELRNWGTTQWAYRGFCLEAFDLVRPAFTKVYGEPPGRPLRGTGCDAINSALVDESFLSAAPGAFGVLADLRPTQNRLDRDPNLKVGFEEFYNTNVTTRRLSLVDRDCYQVMFRAQTRRGAGLIADPARSCVGRSASGSPLENVPIGIMSGSYSATKPKAGSHDFLWGFNPMGFEEADLTKALYWVFSQDWGLAATAP